jgi:hypothetical protein
MGSRRILSDGENMDNMFMNHQFAGSGIASGRFDGGGIAGGFQPPATSRKPAERVRDSEEL